MDLSEVEKAKYEIVWSDPRYRQFSPGEQLVDKAIEWLGMKPGQSVIDYGCGTGRATRKFRDLGFRAKGVDHAENCLETDVPFIQSCLWDLPESLSSDWAFCCDVMEHIPPEKVDETIGQIMAGTNRGGFFNIATSLDGFGPRLIGEPLHLTVRPADWWMAKFDVVRSEVKGTSVSLHVR